ncbi:DedA family protein [Schaalia sp. 19OD2882]|uniref:DedA family protein n=1 Tax=Schaalia sp. 19OD2882 TaxID=2794089 RepID=UPI0020A738B8|nr:DedA family protein [Schaalia sp. 19OD2882]
MGPWVLWGTLLIVLVESGLLFPLLPGDALLFTAGLLHDQLGLNLWVLIGLIFVAAFIGAQCGYWIGAQWGRRLFKDDARILKTKHLVKAENYFATYGGRALVIGRFIPFIRTFVPLAAGIARYPYPKFLAFNSLGALLWGAGVTWAGSLLGGIPFVHDNLSVIILVIVAVSLLPMVVEVVMHRVKGRSSDDEGEGSTKDEGGAAHAFTGADQGAAARARAGEDSTTPPRED